MGRTPTGRTRERVFQFVSRRLAAGDPPTVREVQRAFGFRAVETARRHLETLLADGRLLKEGGKSRGYRLPHGTGAGARGLGFIPLLGEVHAGSLTTAIQNPEGYIPAEAAGGDELFALRVRGESMKDAGILPGDIAVVRRQASASSGEIVIALVGDEATVKRLRLRGGQVELHPENKEFAPIIAPPDAVMILGKVIEVRRRYDVDATRELEG